MNAVRGVSTVRVPKAGEMVASQLRRQIVLGELKEGDQLPSESVLMEQFGVSRPTLREAFRILEAEGAITVRRGVRGGARVQVPDITVAARQIGLLLQYRGALLSDVYEVRAVLEPAAARMAAKRRTSADLARLQEALDRHQRVPGGPGRLVRRRRRLPPAHPGTLGKRDAPGSRRDGRQHHPRGGPVLRGEP